MGRSPSFFNSRSTSSVIVWLWRAFAALQLTSVSAKVVTSRRSSTRISFACFDSAARTAASQLVAATGAGGPAVAGGTARDLGARFEAIFFFRERAVFLAGSVGVLRGRGSGG